MIDVIGSEEVLRTTYNLPEKSAADIIRSLDLLEKYNVPLAPHIVIGHSDGLDGDRAALDLLRGRVLKSIVFVLVMPMGKKDWTHEINIDELRRFFRTARLRFADTPLLLGCARPVGKAQFGIDCAALDAGFDGIAYPAEGIVQRARSMGLRPKFSEFCCSLLMQEEFDGKFAGL